MKQFYQIHELAKLFNLCPDTLRYYEEKGLLHPVRGENRYRMYGIQYTGSIRSATVMPMAPASPPYHPPRRSAPRTQNAFPI